MAEAVDLMLHVTVIETVTDMVVILEGQAVMMTVMQIAVGGSCLIKNIKISFGKSQVKD